MAQRNARILTKDMIAERELRSRVRRNDPVAFDKQQRER
jgi:hypothetical protein